MFVLYFPTFSYGNDLLGGKIATCAPDLKKVENPNKEEIVELEWFQNSDNHFFSIKNKIEERVVKILYKANRVSSSTKSSLEIITNSIHKKFDTITIPLQDDPQITAVDKSKGIFKHPLTLIYKLNKKEVKTISMTCLTGQ